MTHARQIDVATCVPVVIALALSWAAPVLPPAAAVPPSSPPVPEEVSLGPGWTGSQANVVPRHAGARVAISPDDVAVWAAPPTWAPPPMTSETYRDDLYQSEEWRTVHLGLAIAAVGILTAVGLGLSLNRDPDPFDDARLAPSTQFDAFFPR